MSFKVPYLVGDKLRRDHQNWPTILISEIPRYYPGGLTTPQKDRFWPVDLSLAQIMALAWRVQKWKVTGGFTATFSETFSGPLIKSWTGSLTVDANSFLYSLTEASGSQVQSTREIELVNRVYNILPPIRNLVGDGVGADPITPFTASWVVDTLSTPGTSAHFSGVEPQSLNLFGVIPEIGLGGVILFDPITGLFSPPITGGPVLPSTSTASHIRVEAGFSRNPVTLLSSTSPRSLLAPGSCTFTPHIAPDFVVPMQLLWDSDEGVGNPVSGTGSGSFTLEAVQFWAYKNSLGQPVYDTTDGHQINDPFL